MFFSNIRKQILGKNTTQQPLRSKHFDRVAVSEDILLDSLRTEPCYCIIFSFYRLFIPEKPVKKAVLGGSKRVFFSLCFQWFPGPAAGTGRSTPGEPRCGPRCEAWCWNTYKVGPPFESAFSW